MPTTKPIQNFALNAGTDVLVHCGRHLARVQPIRQTIVRQVESTMLDGLKRAHATNSYPPGVDDDSTLMGLALLSTAERALTELHFSPAAIRCLFKVIVQKLLIEKSDREAVARFSAQYGISPPTFLTISPGKACNLRCAGCYADSGSTAEKLDWATFDRLVAEAKTLWGTRLFVISGGEPLAYHSEGKGVLDMAEQHPDCYFLTYTNGTLIDDNLALRLAKTGNLTPTISLEGWRERTDARRGAGIFDRTLETMNRLRAAGVPFGISLTATRYNAEEILSDEFIDFCFEEQGALYGFIFQYMPIGRASTLDLMPTPQQRLWMWRRSWEIIRERRIVLADFWNHGTVSQGCIAAGRYNGGGYLYVDWNGAISPCVFLPYSPVNINDVYAQGKTLNDAWADPFFAGLRQWQQSYRDDEGNWLMPCPIRDHHSDLRRLLAEHEPDPTDANARIALLDEGYARSMAENGAAYQAQSEPVWEKHYLRQGASSDGDIRPLPEIQ